MATPRLMPVQNSPTASLLPRLVCNISAVVAVWPMARHGLGNWSLCAGAPAANEYTNGDPDPVLTATSTTVPTATASSTPRPTATATNTPVPSPTATATFTPMPTPTFTLTPTPTTGPLACNVSPGQAVIGDPVAVVGTADPGVVVEILVGGAPDLDRDGRY